MTSQISLESLYLSWVHGILLCSFCLAWNSLPELISRGVGIRMSWVENFLKIDKRGGGTSIRDQRVITPTATTNLSFNFKTSLSSSSLNFCRKFSSSYMAKFEYCAI